MSTDAAHDLTHVRVDNVGSFLRPKALKDAHGKFTRGEIPVSALIEAQDHAIAEVIERQEALGLPVLVDGEFRRAQFMESFADVAGFEGWHTRVAESRASRELRADDPERVTAPSAIRLTPATERLKLLTNKPLGEWRSAQALTERPVKASLIGPDRVFQTFDEEGSRNVYPTPWEFLDDVASVQNQMVSELADAGCGYVHMDAPGFTAYVDAASRERMRGRGLDPGEVMTRTIRAENQAIAGNPGVTFGIHLCRGNEQSHWHREGTYDAIAEQLFTELDHQRLLLEYDTPRAGSFEPLRFVPKGKVAVLGLITTKDGRLETVDELRRRIDEASKHIAVDQIAISPQCGFASDVRGNNITEAEQWAKLERMLEVAHAVWA